MAISYRAGLALLVVAAVALMASAADPDPLADFVLPGVDRAEGEKAGFSINLRNKKIKLRI